MKKVNKGTKRRLLFLGTFSVFAIIYFLFTFASYAINYSSLKLEEKDLNEQLETLQEEKANLKIEIVKLNDPEYVARYAKENYLYSGDGEYVIKIDEEDNSKEEDKKDNKVLIYSIGISFLVVVILLFRNRKKTHK